MALCSIARRRLQRDFDFLKNLEDNHVIPTLQKVAGDGADLIVQTQTGSMAIMQVFFCMIPLL